MNTIIQESLTYIIIGITSVYSVYKTVLFFTPAQNKNSCTGCSGGSCGVKRTHLPDKLIVSKIPNKEFAYHKFKRGL